MRSVRSVVAFAIVCVACIALALGYGIQARRRAAVAHEDARATVEAPLPPPPADLRQRPHVIFLSTDTRQWGRVLLAASGDPNSPRYGTELTCSRIYYSAGRGICLALDDSIVPRYRLEIFDETFRRTRTVSLPGLPSRARVSSDGRHGAFTVFVTGHTYAITGFSTRTEILELSTGTSLGDLESFTVRRDGTPIKSPDFNFWGVTFVPDSSRFYVTLSTGGQAYLVAGDTESRTADVLRENAECPSLSPDGTRLVYKKRLPTEGVRWQLAVLDLRTNRETRLAAESWNVDDQAEWLDNDRVIYGIPDRSGRAAAAPDLWTMRADGTGEPQLFLADASSPAVVRPGS